MKREEQLAYMDDAKERHGQILNEMIEDSKYEAILAKYDNEAFHEVRRHA